MDTSVRRLRLAGVFVACGLYMPLCVLAAPVRTPEIQVIDMETHAVQFSIPVESDGMRVGLKPLLADIDHDGSTEIVVFESTGSEARPVVRVYDRHGVQKKVYPLFIPEHVGTEMSAAAGNIDSDEDIEFVLSFPHGTTTTVYLFDSTFKYNDPQRPSFVAFPTLATGARVTLANVTGDVVDEIIVGTAAGVKAQVGIFTSHGKQYGTSIFPFADEDTQGVTLTGVATLNQAYDDIAIGLADGAQTWFKVYAIDSAFTYPVLTQQRVWSREWESGVQLAAADVLHDGSQRVIVAPLSGRQAEFVAYDVNGTTTTLPSVYAFEEDFRGGVEFSLGQLDSDLALELVVAPRVQAQRGDLTKGDKYVEVDLSEQTETLWENGYIVQQFLISSGLAPRFTPEGETKISHKKPFVNYDGSIFGESYYFGNTPWNLMFRSGGYYFHTAYWHNDFGRPKSHGCINMKEPDAHFLYDWAPVGTTVIVHQ